MSPELEAKHGRLQGILRGLDSVAVAFSGGVDSTLLYKVAHDVLGDRAVAVTATSETYPEREWEEARAVAASIGGRHLSVGTRELDRENYRKNPIDRCFFCKDELFEIVGRKAAELGLKAVAYGANADDLGDHRPGRRAASERGVVEPLVAAGMTKAEVRALARELGLPNWDRPSYACLGSRFPYGVEITEKRLHQVRDAEEALHALGFRVFRVRYHGEVARVEIGEGEIPRALEDGTRREILRRLRATGFAYVALDLEGYRTGSMNEVLPAEIRMPPRRGTGT